MTLWTKAASQRRGNTRTCAQLALANIVTGVFTPVLAKHSKINEFVSSYPLADPTVSYIFGNPSLHRQWEA